MSVDLTTEATYHEVVWGDDEADRQTFVDYGDGSFISDTAEARATSFFLGLIRQGVTCGFWTNGRLVAGRNATDGPDVPPTFATEPEIVTASSPKHETRTVLDAYQDERYVTKSNGSCGRWVRSDTSVALCTCGWEWHATTRTEARSAARGHRLEAAA